MFEPIKTNEKQQEKKKLSLAEINAKYRVDHNEELKPPEVVLKVHGKIVSTRQNIFGIKGKAKVGKSFLLAIINSVVLKKGETAMLESYLPKGRDKIIVIDTEQSRYHIRLGMDRIKEIAGENKMDNLYVYNLDAVPTAERFEYVETIISQTQGIGLMLIDGIADLVKSVNDEVVACDTADTLRRWATTYDCAIGYVLHENPSDSTKMRGHLGTILTNKSETVIQIESDSDQEHVKQVSTSQTRNAKPEPWSFEIIDGMPVILDEVYVATSAKKRNVQLTDIDRYSILTAVFAGHDVTGISYGIMKENIRDVYIEKFGTVGENKIDNLIKYCKEKKWLTQPDEPKNKNYHLYPFKNE